MKRRIQAGSQGIWRYADFLPFEGRPGDPLEPGLTPLLRADRLAERLGIEAEIWIKNDAANPTHSFKDRVVAVAVAKAQELGFDTVACASTGNLANAVAAHAAAAGLDSYVFVPANLEEQKLLATGVYGTNLVGVRGNYDDVNRLCTQLAETRPWAFVNVNLRPYYAEGSKTLAYETVEQLGWELPDRVVCPIASGSLFTKLGRGFQEWLDLGLVEGDSRSSTAPRREGCSPVATAFAEGWDVCKPQRPETIAKSLAIGDPADGPYAVEHARRTGGGDRLGHRRRDPRRDQAAGRDHRDLHRDRRRGHRRRPAQAGRTGRARRRRAGRRLHHRRGPEDARRDPRYVPDARDRPRPRELRGRVPPGGSRLMSVTVKIPTQLRAATGGEAELEVEARTVGEVLDAVFDAHDGLRERITQDGDLRRFVNVYVSGEDIRFQQGLETRSTTAPRSRSCRRSRVAERSSGRGFT